MNSTGKNPEVDAKSLTLADALKLLRDDVQVENTLIAVRMSWFVTSQAFMLAAYASSWAYKFELREFLAITLPPLGFAVSISILASISAASWAQSILIARQLELIEKIEEMGSALSKPESIALASYSMSIASNRKHPKGKHVRGNMIHWLGRGPAFFLPILFGVVWIWAFIYSLDALH
jgi:hypothetical protein